MRSLFILISLVFAIGARAQPAPDAWQLLIAGTYHDGEAPARPGTGWLALVSVGGVWRLEPAMVWSTRVYDGLLDAEGQKTGISITSNYADALALLRFPDIQSGKVDTPNLKFKDNPRPLTNTMPLKLFFKGEDYAIEAKSADVFLRNGKTKTLLPGLTVRSPAGEDSASLLWAGDLDGDGKLDLLFAYTGYNNGGVCLYLSANAGEGALVRRAACHSGVGC